LALLKNVKFATTHFSRRQSKHCETLNQKIQK